MFNVTSSYLTCSFECTGPALVRNAFTCRNVSFVINIDSSLKEHDQKQPLTGFPRTVKSKYIILM